MGYAGSTTDVLVRDCWRTPRWLFDFFNARYNFTADIAALPHNALCDRFITEEENALDGFWGDIGGTVWCNPPYSDIGPWVWGAEQSAGVCTGTLMLVPADPGVGWFEESLESASKVIWITGGRVPFVHPVTGIPIADNMKGSVLLEWQPDSQRLETEYVSLSYIQKQAQLLKMERRR